MRFVDIGLGLVEVCDEGCGVTSPRRLVQSAYRAGRQPRACVDHCHICNEVQYTAQSTYEDGMLSSRTLTVEGEVLRLGNGGGGGQLSKRLRGIITGLITSS